MLELLLELDPEDHLEAIILLAFNYLAMEEYELFDEVSNDISDKYACKEVLTMWAAFRRSGRIPEGDPSPSAAPASPPLFCRIYRRRTSCRRAVPEGYRERAPSSVQAQARELWLRTENLWTLFPDFYCGASKVALPIFSGAKLPARAYMPSIVRVVMRGGRFARDFPILRIRPA